MRLLIAPDKFKGCLSAPEVASAIARGAQKARADLSIDLCPLADGGEGTVEALVTALHGELKQHTVTGPLPEMKVPATFGWLPKEHCAVIEMASASGLALLSTDQQDPLATTTFGTGELLKYAAQLGAKKIILGIGGSATCDAGIGCAHGAGLPVLLQGGEPTYDTEPLCGRDMDRVVLVKHGRGSPVDGVEIIVACDVTNPLFGPNGAAYVFAPQKGASPAVVKQLDLSLKSLARRLNQLQLASEPGSGAAGGLGFGMRAYFGATLARGFDLIADATHLSDRIQQADLVITGEGKLDSQTSHGKTASGVGELCRRLGKPCIAIAGIVDAPPDIFQSTHAIRDLATSSEDSMTRARELLVELSHRVIAGLVG